MHELAIRQGRLITPSGPALADLAIDRGRIAAIGKNLNAAQEVDASGCLVLPGGGRYLHRSLAAPGNLS